MDCRVVDFVESPHIGKSRSNIESKIGVPWKIGMNLRILLFIVYVRFSHVCVDAAVSAASFPCSIIVVRSSNLALFCFFLLAWSLALVLLAWDCTWYMFHVVLLRVLFCRAS